MMITTDYCRYLMDTYSALVHSVSEVVELLPSEKLTEFVEGRVAARRESDAVGDVTRAQLAKLQVSPSPLIPSINHMFQMNSSYGYSLFR